MEKQNAQSRQNTFEGQGRRNCSSAIPDIKTFKKLNCVISILQWPNMIYDRAGNTITVQGQQFQFQYMVLGRGLST